MILTSISEVHVKQARNSAVPGKPAAPGYAGDSTSCRALASFTTNPHPPQRLCLQRPSRPTAKATLLQKASRFFQLQQPGSPPPTCTERCFVSPGCSPVSPGIPRTVCFSRLRPNPVFVNEGTVGSRGMGLCPGAERGGPDADSPNRAGCLRFSPESSFFLLPPSLKLHACSAEREGDLIFGSLQTASFSARH